MVAARIRLFVDDKKKIDFFWPIIQLSRVLFSLHLHRIA